jgi:hypothetical protein
MAAWVVAQAAHAEPPSDAPTAEPVWLHQPSEMKIASVYPIAADRNHTLGRVSMRCGINAHGDLRDCSVIDETPAGAGFGAKALELTREFRSKKLASDGAPAAGRTMILSIEFTPRDWARLVDDPADPIGTQKLVRWVTDPRLHLNPPYPFEARLRAVSARVVLRCRARADGSLEPCAIVEETPKGLGFGKAAVLGARTLLVSRQASDGTPIAGRRIEVPVVFNPPCDGLTLDEQTSSGCPTLPMASAPFR